MNEFTGYGFCPKCGARGQQREKRPNGNDICLNGHTYPSAGATPEAITNHGYEKGDKVLITSDIIGLRYLNGTTGIIDAVTIDGYCIIKQTLVKVEYLTKIEADE